MKTMPSDDVRSNGCTGNEEILDDLTVNNLLSLESGERLWKLYCFRTAGHATGLRHRIYTKQKADGRLALVTFAMHNPPETPGNGRSGMGRRAVRSGIARVPDLSPLDLDRVIAAVRAQAQAASDLCEEADLSAVETLDEQIAWLKNRQRAAEG
jgi:hypothetical protein